ncbi:MAG: DUF547 domain-containing protein [Pseudomonadota bacterium]
MLRFFVFTAVLFAATLPARAGIERLFAPGANLENEIWLEHRPGSTVRVDHTPWDQVLAAHVETGSDGINRFDYAAVSPSERAALGAYLTALQGVDPTTLDRDEQLAFWINLYNAQTVATILAHYPVGSIREIGSGLFSSGPWDAQAVTVLGRELSLNDIEHGIVRPVYREPRIHYALNCAALGCPNLGARAYRGASLEIALTTAEAAYVNNPRGVRLDGGRLVLSSIYNWFREDFGASEADVLDRLRTVASGPAAAALKGRTEVDAYAYDWRLNAP